MDADADGLISESDLKSILTSLGETRSLDQLPTLGTVASFLPRSSSSGIDFVTFLSMMSGRLLELDPENEVLEAFECFDEAERGVISASYLRNALEKYGDCMSADEIDAFLSPPFVTRQGDFKYREFIKILHISNAEEQQRH